MMCRHIQPSTANLLRYAVYIERLASNQFPVTGALWQHHSLHWYTEHGGL